MMGAPDPRAWRWLHEVHEDRLYRHRRELYQRRLALVGLVLVLVVACLVW